MCHGDDPGTFTAVFRKSCLLQQNTHYMWGLLWYSFNHTIPKKKQNKIKNYQIRSKALAVTNVDYTSDNNYHVTLIIIIFNTIKMQHYNNNNNNNSINTINREQWLWPPTNNG